MLFVNQLVELLDEVYRLEVFAAAVFVRHPAALLARVVEIKHRGDRVDSHTVDVILLQPEQGVSEQIISDLVAFVVEDQSAPILMLAFARIRVLVQMSAVEIGQAVPVLWKVSGHPIQNYTYAVAMTVIDEIHEVVGLAVPAGRREVADRLIAPASVVRMFSHRQQLDVRVAHLLHILDEVVSKLTVVEIAASLFRRSHP